MSSEKLYSEIFEEFEKAESRAAKIDILKKYDHPRFRDFLVAAFNPVFQFEVEIPKYRPAPEPAGLNFTYLDIEVPKLYRFIKGHPKRISQIPLEKQKSLLVVVLESLHKDEADLLVRCIKKDLNIKFLTPKVIKEAFPDINL
jgi:hypothetical protein